MAIKIVVNYCYESVDRLILTRSIRAPHKIVVHTFPKFNNSINKDNGKLATTSDQFSHNIKSLSNKTQNVKLKVLLLGWNNNPSILDYLSNGNCVFSQLQVLTLSNFID